MILTYSQYLELNNSDSVDENIDVSPLLISIIETLQEHKVLTDDEMVSLFKEAANYHEYDIVDEKEYIDFIVQQLNPYVNEHIDESGDVQQYSYSLVDDETINEFMGKLKTWGDEPEKPKSFLHGLGMGANNLSKGASKALGSAPKAWAKSQEAGHKAGLQKQKNLMKHDYKMAKLSGKTAAGGFDNYTKLSGSANNRY